MSDKLRWGTNPEVEVNKTYANYFSTMALFKKFIDSCADAVVTAVSDDNKTVDVKLVAGERMENGDDLPQLEYKGIPIAQMSCASGIVRFKISVGDIGIIFARKYDINMPNPESGVPERSQVKSGRLMSFVQGFFMPIAFAGSAEVDFHLQSGDSYVKMDQGNMEVSLSGNANITASNATITANVINLGGAGGVGVARIGDSVDPTTLKIVSGSTKVLSL